MADKYLKINYYISGHGYGHATRSARLIEALLDAKSNIHITVITTAPAHLFPISDRITLAPWSIDSAVIQPQPYSVDAAATFVELKRFLQQVDTSEWRANAQALVKPSRCQLILADALCPFPWFGYVNGVPSILISNFSFDAIFHKLLEYLPPEETVLGIGIVSKLELIYSSYDYILRLPGFIEFPFVQSHWPEEKRQARLIDAPLVFRTPRCSRDSMLQTLGIPAKFFDAKILLVQFGGQSVSSGGDGRLDLPIGWICLSNFAISDSRVFAFQKDVYSPDLVALSDAVLGKIGYGTVSECVGLAKPLIFVRRPMFAEEPGLLQYMEEHGTCSEISVADYEAGSWRASIAKVTKAHAEAQRSGVADGSPELAQMILEIAKNF